MKKNYLLLVFLISTRLIFGQTWEQWSDFPGTARDDGSVFTIGIKHYAGLGRDLGFSCTRDFYVFDDFTQGWNSAPALPLGQERQYAVGCAWNGAGFIFGGATCDGTFLNDLWQFDPVSSNWTQLTSLPSDGRGGSNHFILGDTLYVVGGRNTNGILGEVWAYNFNTDSWTQKTDYPGDGIWRGLSFYHEGKGYAGFGKNNLNSQSEFNTEIYSFQPEQQIWNLEPSLGIAPRSYFGSAQNDSLVFLFGGLDPTNTILDSFQRINLSPWTVSTLPNFTSAPRRGSMCFLSNDWFYTSTGVSTTARLDETWRIGGVLDVEESNLESNIQINPNPCSSSFVIANVLNVEQIEILSSEGKSIKTFKTFGQSQVEINIKDLVNGYYIVKVGNRIESLMVENY